MGDVLCFDVITNDFLFFYSILPWGRMEWFVGT